MGLIASPRHTAADLECWAEFEHADRVYGKALSLQARVEQSLAAIRSFAAAGPCYASVSWGKDSVVLASLVRRVDPAIPLVWVKVEPIANPDCEAVRDAFRVPARHRQALAGRVVLLVDDVFTSGATAEACARALKGAGAREVRLLCWARVLREDGAAR